jgi:hypothetical protein
MSRSYRSRLTRCALALTLLAVTIGALATSASAATKMFALSISPQSVGAGTTQAYSATITNESGSTLDSVTLAPPAGFTVLSPGGTFGGLGLGNGSSTTVNFSARTPCVANGSSFTWSATGKAANNQPYALDTATSQLAAGVTGSCSLAISHVGSGERNAFLSTADYEPFGGPTNPAAVTVQLRDADNALITSANGTGVKLTLSPNATALSGDSANLAGGVATFSSLKVTESGLSDTVTASIPTNSSITAAQSNGFQIWDKDIKCHANNPCGQPYAAGDLTTKPNATFSSDGGILVSYDVQSALCPVDSYSHLPNVVSIDSEGHQLPSGDWIITFSVSKLYDQRQSQNGASFYQICLATTVPFTTLAGSPPVVHSGDFYYGLVQNSPQCDETAPCLLSKTKTKTGVVNLVLRLDAGDPWTH